MHSTVDFINKKNNNFKPDIALVLGSGLGEFTKNLNGITIPYSDIPNFKTSTVKGHNGSLFFTELFNKKLVVMQGRLHFYEGYNLSDITYPIKVFKNLGVKTVILTNAAGSVKKDLKPSDLMLISDHINFTSKNPLIGPNDDTLGERFPDMSDIYTKSLRDIVKQCAKETGTDLKEGVYIMTTGPSYETPAEVRMFNILGADAVGMSTVPEAIVSNYLGLQTIGISLISNYASGISDTKLNHAEVVEMGKVAASKFTKLINAIIEKI